MMARAICNVRSLIADIFAPPSAVLIEGHSFGVIVDEADLPDGIERIDGHRVWGE